MKIASRILFLLGLGTLSALFITSSANAQPDYTLTELSLGGTWGTAVGLNETGQVTGRSEDAQGNGQTYIYDPIGGIQEISLGGTWSEPFAISETGQVVGYSQKSEGGQSAFVYGHVDYLFLPVAPGLTGGAFAYDFNQKGEVVGNSYTQSGWQAFVYSPTRGIQQISLGVGHVQQYGIKSEVVAEDDGRRSGGPLSRGGRCPGQASGAVAKGHGSYVPGRGRLRK
jgi:probable HAF family extracellular repeat protein